ncbi:MAG: citrate transporter [Lachnospiraceae bacterium]|nr:citrate transporter [Lachnospiraceae bacterium]
MSKILSFIKNEIVFSIAMVLAIISSFIVPPSKAYIEYIDFRTLALLLGLMLVVQGLKSCGLFDSLVATLVKKVSSKRSLALMLVSLCFFGSMLITNDVALITFVPFTIMVLALCDDSKYSIYLIVLETVAANLGSMFTPIGNPQNLYLYSISGMSMGEFLKLMFPYTALSFVLLVIAIYFVDNEPFGGSRSHFPEGNISKAPLVIYIALFLLCILTVLYVVDYRIMLAVVIVTIFIMNKQLLLKADYILLLTFIAFFVFIGNMKNIQVISDFLGSVVNNREVYVSVAASQLVSNVPAAMLLSGFTTNYQRLIIGTNIGGLGTIIASMASLISYKFYCKISGSNQKMYMMKFTVVNLLFLAILLCFYMI